MNKFLAVVKREYVQRVRSRMFLVATLLGPLMLVLFTVVPAMLSRIKTGGPVRLAVVDNSGRLSERVRQSILAARDDSDEDEGQSAEERAMESANQNTAERLRKTGAAIEQSYTVETIESNGKPLDDIKRELNERVKHGELDAYLILPPEILENGEAEFYARNVGDVFTKRQIADRLTNAVREQRMVERDIQPGAMREINKSLTMKSSKIGESGTVEEDSGQGFVMIFILGFTIYFSILMYGQVILGAVVEEKETRIAEVLFSSMRAFPLMLGKLIGVSLVALTQFAIWGLAFAVFALYGVAMLAASGVPINLPHVQPLVFIYFPLFFLLGYFLYSTIYALVGSMVTTSQEGGQLALPIILILVFAFYLAFPVIRSPNSPFAFWVSMVPFFAPITMLVRIVTQTPPFWQIALSLALGYATVVLLIWIAARIYRVGMLMYGKKASIPEAWRWLRQS